MITSTSDDNGNLYLETSELYSGDCKSSSRSRIAHIKDLRGNNCKLLFQYLSLRKDDKGVRLWRLG